MHGAQAGQGAASRVEPSWKVAAAVVVGYVVLVTGAMAASGVAYTDIFLRESNVWKAAVVPLLIGAVYTTAAVALLGWDEIWRDRVRLPMSRVLWLLIGLTAAAAAIRLAGLHWGEIPAGLLVAVVLAGALVGYAEELLFRGIVLRGLRAEQRSESWAALWTALGFGIFHITNVLIGGGVGSTVFQVVFTTAIGYVFYLTRRARGLLVLAMALHGIWDVSAFLADRHGKDSDLVELSNVLTLVVMLLALFGMFAVRRLDRSAAAQKP